MDISCLDTIKSKKLPSSNYKGVVSQPNGRWGAQIYEKHQRVWLGTFNEEERAAKAYDIAVQRFRGQNAITNFKPPLDPNKDDIETFFLNSHSKAEIVDMLRKHTYLNELEQSKYNFACHGTSRKRIRGNGFSGISGSHPFELLFEKVATPSDVGKLNRMVVPKQHAEKHFPLHNNGIALSKGVLLNFEDNVGQVWRFRYCYWGSSQSYVLTKGWSRFVKEKNLKAGDMVCFWRSMGFDDKRLFIDRKVQNRSGLVDMSNRVDPLIPVQSIRLFGVNILETPRSFVVDNRGYKSQKKKKQKLKQMEQEV